MAKNKDIWVWVVKVCKRDECNEEFGRELHYYPSYILWVLENDYPDKFPAGEYDKTWASALGYEVPELDDYICMVVHETYPVDRETSISNSFTRAPTNDEISKAVKEGHVIDLTPNEQRMREYKIYKWWLEKYQYILALVGAETNHLIQEIKEILR